MAGKGPQLDVPRDDYWSLMYSCFPEMLTEPLLVLGTLEAWLLIHTRQRENSPDPPGRRLSGEASAAADPKAKSAPAPRAASCDVCSPEAVRCRHSPCCVCRDTLLDSHCAPTAAHLAHGGLAIRVHFLSSPPGPRLHLPPAGLLAATSLPAEGGSGHSPGLARPLRTPGFAPK